MPLTILVSEAYDLPLWQVKSKYEGVDELIDLHVLPYENLLLN